MGRKIGAVSFLQILAPELNDRILSDILDLETGVIVNLHIRSIDQSEAIKTIKRKITDLDKMKSKNRRKPSVPAMTWILFRPDLATFGSEAKKSLAGFTEPGMSECFSLRSLLQNNGRHEAETGK